MKTRIKELILKEKLNSAQFAIEIGIAASSLHHIVSGRNNPSLEVIQKILLRYPQINAEWLINGKGAMFKDLVQGELFSVPETPNKDSDIVDIEQDIPLIDSVVNKTSKDEPIKEIEKIVLFYTDNTFKIYNS